MSYSLVGNILTLPSAADLSASYQCAVTINSSGKFALAGAGGAVAGILTDKVPAADLACPAQFQGVAPWKLGGTVTAGEPVKSDASGRAVTASVADVAAGLAKGIAVVGGTVGQIGSVLLLATASGFSGSGVEDALVLASATALAPLASVHYLSTTGTVSGALGAGIYEGQTKDIIQSVAASSPVGTVAGTFLTLAGAAATTLALGTAVAYIGKFVWTGSAWRLASPLGGTGSSLS